MAINVKGLHQRNIEEVRRKTLCNCYGEKKYHGISYNFLLTAVLKSIQREIAEIIGEFGGQRGGKRYVSFPSDRQTHNFISAFSR